MKESVRKHDVKGIGLYDPKWDKLMKWKNWNDWFIQIQLYLNIK